jgi:hypothetical protein
VTILRICILTCAIFPLSILRCSCQEKEVDSFEKDLDITDLKAQVVSLSSMVEQLRLHKAELDHAKPQVSGVGFGPMLFNNLNFNSFSIGA